MSDSTPPPNVSCARLGEDGRLHAPAAERNIEALLAVLRDYAPETGYALELASGTGQHIARFAAEFPKLSWQPTEIDQSRLASIETWRQASGCSNLLPAQRLDATQSGWGQTKGPAALVLLVNLLHLIGTPQARTLIAESGEALGARGVLILYGPFLRDGRATSAGDRAFHAQLQASDPEIGYKDASDVEHWMQEAGLEQLRRIEMPANNLVLTARNS